MCGKTSAKSRAADNGMLTLVLAAFALPKVLAVVCRLQNQCHITMTNRFCVPP